MSTRAIEGPFTNCSMAHIGTLANKYFYSPVEAMPPPEHLQEAVGVVRPGDGLQPHLGSLPLVNSSVRKIKPAFAGKCIAVAVACVGKAAEPKGVRWRISFPTKNRAECTC
jgi:hypothetical protein